MADDQQSEPDDQQENDDGDGEESGQDPETDETPDKEADPEDSGEADDGDGEAGEPGADDDKTSRAVKRRLQRERRKTEKILSEKEKEIEALKAQIGVQAKEPTEDPSKQPTESKYPQLVDYPDVTSWIADIRRYNAGEAMLGPDGEGAKTAPEPEAKEPAEKSSVENPQIELKQQQRLQSYFADLRETLDESDQVSDDEIDDFDARLKDSKIPLSEPMWNGSPITTIPL